jgi:hypothetical protein
MKAFHNYWSFSAIRGGLTVIVSVGILGLPYFAHALMTIPVMLGLAIDVLAVYAMLEGGALVLLGVSMPANFLGHKTRYAEAAASVAIGAVLFLMAHGEFSQYVMWVVAAQAAIAAVAEYSVARQTYREYKCLSCYVSAFVLAACAMALPFAGAMSLDNQLFTLSTYVGLYGTTQILLGARMLFLEYRAEHPALGLSDAWRAELNNPRAGLPGRVENHFGSIGQRVGAAISRGYIVPGHGRIIPAQRKAA